MAYEEPANYDVTHHVRQVIKPLYQAQRELDFLNRYVTMNDAGVAAFRLTQGQLDKLASLLGELKASYTKLEQAHKP